MSISACLKKQLKDHQNVRNFSSVVNDLNGGEEPVEISAIMIEREQPLFGYSVRSIGRRERDLPQSGGNYPRSVEQLTELVGRKPLKEIVRESTDLIERMCIEAALVHTADNRASAAEISGAKSPKPIFEIAPPWPWKFDRQGLNFRQDS